MRILDSRGGGLKVKSWKGSIVGVIERFETMRMLMIRMFDRHEDVVCTRCSRLQWNLYIAWIRVLHGRIERSIVTLQLPVVVVRREVTSGRVSDLYLGWLECMKWG
ncbi:hypothetical protein KC19_3G070900 [Ceratodon purpureus]|uniref:Uncharacterized protein n=1 Tax=Ceratodon purpureus TaxID=3225 RepID=A0A8T0IFS6_CERPU|nr:hypothetical protein KC19_3G070900 [Ceratodon purpureus]